MLQAKGGGSDLDSAHQSASVARRITFIFYNDGESLFVD